ncbi:hypothetical protein [Moraxella sp. VT-16-12]|uniref:hypothetical protein n=1 Tax=Moraxella sp. VT-16-12 TaxID=2014877 RepID=UPI000B7DECE1|nr:hypothetical protein [Moraxella sp. VT-16-12]TWV82385.1 hypothetical protein CEW93_005625 [Moraxella sp. VT-16-12]
MTNSYFNKLVELFRSIPKDSIIEFSESKFHFNGVYSVDIAQKIEYLEEHYHSQFSENFEDDFSQFEKDEFISFECYLPKNENGRFFEDLKSLISNRRSIDRGQYLGNYYIINMDFLGNESSFSNENINLEIKKLKNICLLISFLREIGESNDSNSINMIIKSSIYGDLIVIDSKISIEVFNDISEEFVFEDNLYDLIDLNHKNSHRLEKAKLLKLAIAKNAYDKYRTINDIKIDFIANHWGEICEQYKNNLSAYLDNFSFDKTVQEITDEKLKFVKAIDTVIKESTTKILSTPLSLIAVLTAITANNNFLITNFITIISLFIFGLILTMNLNFQKNIKKDIYEQAKTTFDNHDNESNSEIDRKISTALNEIATTSKEFDKTILVFHLLSWLPLCLLILLLMCKVISSIC